MSTHDGTRFTLPARERFDVRAFARTVHGSHRDQLDLTAFAVSPLSPTGIRMLALLRTLEAATMHHLRNLLVTATHKDARVTAFLVSWAFEKFWIADSLAALLEANGETELETVNAAEGSGRLRRDRAEARERRGPVRRAVSGMRIGVPLVGVHMASGVIDGWITDQAYAAIEQEESNAALTRELERIRMIKARHTGFFAEESATRLASSPRAARLARDELRHGAWPIGAITRSHAERDIFETYVFGGADGHDRARELERLITDVPGLDHRTARTILDRLVP